MKSVSALLSEVRNCNICTNHLPFPPRPVLQLHARARILIVGQAPGRKVHESGIPFADMSGNRLRKWLGVSSEVFYDPCAIAILPMGLCFPGTGNAGDSPPRPECVPAWREKLMTPLKNVKLTLVLGKYAQAYYFPDSFLSVTNTVQSWHEKWPDLVPMPHPSPRNNLWFRRNPWFEAELLPLLRNRVIEVLKEKD